MDSIITSSSSLLIVLLLLHYFSQTTEATHCSPSACGVIPNISPPFRLKNDPKHCGHRELELACEDNVTSIYYNSHKYYVKDINYDNSSIRLVDASINSDSICSFPTSSAYLYNFTRGPLRDDFDYRAWPVNFISCPNPLETYNSSLFTNITRCSSNFPSRNRYVYVKIGHVNASDVQETCMVEVIAMTSWEFKDVNNVSLSEMHDSLVYGFELTVCPGCKGLVSIFNDWDVVVYVLVVVGLLCGMVSPPLMTIFGFAALLTLICHFIADGLLLYALELVFQRDRGVVTYMYRQEQGNRPDSVVKFAQFVPGFIIWAPRFMIFPIALWLLIYKFQRRHLSIYNMLIAMLLQH